MSSHALSPANRREHERAPAYIQVSYPSAGILHTDYTENISRGGLFIATDEAFELGQRIEIRLTCGAESIPVEGVVRWAGDHDPEDGGEPVRGVGVAFELQDAAARARLEGRIDALLGALRTPAPDPERGATVLVVDPNRHARLLFREGLEALARQTFEVEDFLRVVEAEDGADALAAMAREPFALLMLELRTPGIDGVDLIRRIRTHVSPVVPIFAMSRPFPGAREEALAAGADVFLPKPLRLRPLFNTLRMMLKLG